MSPYPTFGFLFLPSLYLKFQISSAHTLGAFRLGESEWEDGLAQDNVVATRSSTVIVGNLAGILALGPETPQAPFLPLHLAVLI